MAVAAVAVLCAATPRPAGAFGLSFARIFQRADAGSTFGAVSTAVFGLESPAASALPVPARAVRLVVFGQTAYAPAAEPVFAGLARRASPARRGLSNVEAPSVPAFATDVVAPRPPAFASGAVPDRALPTAAGTPSAADPVEARASYVYPVPNPFLAAVPRFFSAEPPATAAAGGVSAALRIGGATLGSSLVGQHLQDRRLGFGRAAGDVPASAVRLQWDKLAGGVSFPVPVLGKHVSVNLNADVEHLFRRDATAYPDLPLDTGAAAVRYFPNYVDVVHATLTAGASVPLTRDVVVSASYDTQGYHGSYGATVGQSLAERKDQVQGTVTYTIPKTSSSLSVLFRNQQYHDPVLPTYNFNANREDLNFTVRF